MLGTFGLSRLETRLDTSSETFTAADVAAMLKNLLAKTKTAWAESGTPQSERVSLFEAPKALPQRDPSLDVSNYVLPCSPPRQHGFADPVGERPSAAPSRARHGGNPQFRQTRQANRV